MLNVGATCAGAGIIVGVVTLTGLGLKFSSIVIDYAGGSLLLTAIFTALVVWIVGLAVPVTASYIICAVIAAPALIKLGVPDFAAHMFIFYYAVLSEVSPPTALSPFAAAAITGGDPYKTTLQCWKYTVPAFLLPFMFVLDRSGQGLLLMGSTKALAAADWLVDRPGDAHRRARHRRDRRRLPGLGAAPGDGIERCMLIVAGVALAYPGGIADVVGLSAGRRRAGDAALPRRTARWCCPRMAERAAAVAARAPRLAGGRRRGRRPRRRRNRPQAEVARVRRRQGQLAHAEADHADGADRLERTDAAAPRLEHVVAGRQGTGRDHRAGSGPADANAAERPRQRIADEDALSRHEDALPVRLDQRLAAEVVRHDDADLGKLGAKVARLAARAVAAGRPGLEPLERGRLAAARSRTPPNDVR